MEHHFNIDVACKYGVLEAVLLNNLYFWISKNVANGKNYHDGKCWTYNSIKALQKLFPYASDHKIRKALKTLEDEGVIITGNYNKSSYDRTMWYALTEKGLAICQNYKMEMQKTANGNAENDKPIPDNNTDNNTNIIIEYLNEQAGTNYKSTTRKTKECIRARINEGFTVDDCKKVIRKKVKEWKGTEWEKYLRPQTLFGTKFEAYLNQKATTNNPFVDMLGVRE